MSGSLKIFDNLAAVEIPANPPPIINIFPFASLAFAIVAALACVPPVKKAAPPRPTSLKASLLEIPAFFNSLSNIYNAFFISSFFI